MTSDEEKKPRNVKVLWCASRGMIPAVESLLGLGKEYTLTTIGDLPFRSRDTAIPSRWEIRQLVAATKTVKEPLLCGLIEDDGSSGSLLRAQAINRAFRSRVIIVIDEDRWSAWRQSWYFRHGYDRFWTKDQAVVGLTTLIKSLASGGEKK